jgi:hypothetical protein
VRHFVDSSTLCGSLWTAVRCAAFCGQQYVVRHFVDSSTLCGSLWTAVRCAEFCQVLGLGVCKKVGIEWNRTVGSRMVLTERQESSLLRETDGTVMYGTNSAQ